MISRLKIIINLITISNNLKCSFKSIAGSHKKINKIPCVVYLNTYKTVCSKDF